MITLQHYREALEQFKRTCETLGDRVVSVILFGSLARGEVSPGESDILDAIVVLPDRVFAGKAEFCQTLGVLVEACKDLASSGLPFHPFLYYSQSEFSHRFLSYFSLTHSKVLLGSDVRESTGEADRDGSLNQLAFFGCRRLMQRAARLADLHMTDQTAAQNTVEWFLKTMFTAAAFACGQETFYPESVQLVRRLLPELNLENLDSVVAFKRSQAPTPAAAREALRHALDITENLNDLLEKHLRSNDRWGPISSRWEPRP
ncbi:MAG TPA: nucleotidyltransferase domain-containing protein [Bryobacteraceae bacterium]|jgi:predicted nucleotidyltransferase|nr:nucleotidyltransferase domain-containing protein [Bryobacteraceae bacterium]